MCVPVWALKTQVQGWAYGKFQKLMSAEHWTNCRPFWEQVQSSCTGIMNTGLTTLCWPPGFYTDALPHLLCFPDMVWSRIFLCLLSLSMYYRVYLLIMLFDFQWMECKFYNVISSLCLQCLALTRCLVVLMNEKIKPSVLLGPLSTWGSNSMRRNFVVALPWKYVALIPEKSKPDIGEAHHSHIRSVTIYWFS